MEKVTAQRSCTGSCSSTLFPHSLYLPPCPPTVSLGPCAHPWPLPCPVWLLAFSTAEHGRAESKCWPCSVTQEIMPCHLRQPSLLLRSCLFEVVHPPHSSQALSFLLKGSALVHPASPPLSLKVSKRTPCPLSYGQSDRCPMQLSSEAHVISSGCPVVSTFPGQQSSILLSLTSQLSSAPSGCTSQVSPVSHLQPLLGEDRFFICLHPRSVLTLAPLRQCFSSFKVHANHMGTVLKCRF